MVLGRGRRVPRPRLLAPVHAGPRPVRRHAVGALVRRRPLNYVHDARSTARGSGPGDEPGADLGGRGRRRRARSPTRELRDAHRPRRQRAAARSASATATRRPVHADDPRDGRRRCSPSPSSARSSCRSSRATAPTRSRSGSRRGGDAADHGRRLLPARQGRADEGDRRRRGRAGADASTRVLVLRRVGARCPDGSRSRRLVARRSWPSRVAHAPTRRARQRTPAAASPTPAARPAGPRARCTCTAGFPSRSRRRSRYSFDLRRRRPAVLAHRHRLDHGPVGDRRHARRSAARSCSTTARPTIPSPTGSGRSSSATGSPCSASSPTLDPRADGARRRAGARARPLVAAHPRRRPASRGTRSRGAGTSTWSAAAAARSSTISGGTEVGGGFLSPHVVAAADAVLARRPRARAWPSTCSTTTASRCAARSASWSFRKPWPGMTRGFWQRPGALPRDVLVALARRVGARRLGERSTTTATGSCTAAPTTRSRSRASGSARPRSSRPLVGAPGGAGGGRDRRARRVKGEALGVFVVLRPGIAAVGGAARRESRPSRARRSARRCGPSRALRRASCRRRATPRSCAA